jgi:hypothetical protein
MTDSIKTILDLTKLSVPARMDVDAVICSEVHPSGELKREYSKPSTQQSPMADTKTTWLVRSEKSSDGYFVPTSIEANLNIPNAVAGHNIVHGTSVFASAVSAFHLQRIWMATSGVARTELDKLTLSDMSLSGATVSYPQHWLNEGVARGQVRAIYHTAKGLYGEQCTLFSSANDTVYIQRGEYEIVVYNKTDCSRCAFKPGTPVRSVLEMSSSIVRIEVKLGKRFLRKHGLLSVESWRNAYAEGLYEKLFDETVRKTLRLQKGGLRHKAPRPEVFSKLTEMEAHILYGYLAGRDPRESKAVMASSRPSNRFYELRKALLEKAQVDIDIPWATHRTLRCFELAQTLRYQGDFNPSPDLADWSFCRSSWDTLRESMHDLYEEAVARAEAKAAFRIKTED